jgi:hypothetical protein
MFVVVLCAQRVGAQGSSEDARDRVDTAANIASRKRSMLVPINGYARREPVALSL